MAGIVRLILEASSLVKVVLEIVPSVLFVCVLNYKLKSPIKIHDLGVTSRRERHIF